MIRVTSGFTVPVNMYLRRLTLSWATVKIAGTLHGVPYLHSQIASLGLLLSHTTVLGQVVDLIGMIMVMIMTKTLQD